MELTVRVEWRIQGERGGWESGSGSDMWNFEMDQRSKS